MSDNPKDKAKVIKSEGQKPCGCYVIEYSDDTMAVNHCVPCGLMAVASSLGESADHMSRVAKRMRAEVNNAQMNNAVGKIITP